MNFCHVAGCRFARTHVTKAHICGKCSRYGHVRVECGNNDMITELEEYTDDLPEDMHCTFSSCVDSQLHTNNNHKCGLCNKLKHCETECKKFTNEIKIKCPHCRQEYKFGDELIIHKDHKRKVIKVK
jgi:hypothetical protein